MALDGNFPGSLDTETTYTATDKVSTIDHANVLTKIEEVVVTLEDKVGADSSAVTTSHDYKLGEVTGSDKAVSKTATQTLTNKTLTTINTAITVPSGTDTLVARATTDTLTNKTLTSPVLNTAVSGTAILDEDTMVSNSATHLATQQSIKAYVDASAVSAPVTKTGVATKDMADASTTQVIAHGLATAPAVVRLTNLFASGSAMLNSIGTFSSSGNTCIANSERSGTGVIVSSTSFSILLGNPNAGSMATINQEGVVTVDSTNITITWTKNGSPTGTSSFQWDATA